MFLYLDASHLVIEVTQSVVVKFWLGANLCQWRIVGY